MASTPSTTAKKPSPTVQLIDSLHTNAFLRERLGRSETTAFYETVRANKLEAELTELKQAQKEGIMTNTATAAAPAAPAIPAPTTTSLWQQARNFVGILLRYLGILALIAGALYFAWWFLVASSPKTADMKATPPVQATMTPAPAQVTPASTLTLKTEDIKKLIDGAFAPLDSRFKELDEKIEKLAKKQETPPAPPIKEDVVTEPVEWKNFNARAKFSLAFKLCKSGLPDVPLHEAVNEVAAWDWKKFHDEIIFNCDVKTDQLRAAISEFNLQVAAQGPLPPQTKQKAAPQTDQQTKQARYRYQQNDDDDDRPGFTKNERRRFCPDPKNQMEQFIKINGPKPRPNCFAGPIPGKPCQGWVCPRGYN